MRTVRPDEWTDEDIRRLWAFKVGNPQDEALYFSKMVGRGIARFLELSGFARGRALDFGCGPGYLLAELVPRVHELHGVDFSKEAIAATEDRLAGRPGWRGARTIETLPTDFPDASFDLVTCVETIEHLREEQLSATLREVWRLLRPGNAALFTTPNEEDLGRSYAYCPFCDTRFHEWQHLRSFSEASLRAVLEHHGFSVVFCRGIDLTRFQSDGRPEFPLTARLRWMLRWGVLALLDRRRPRAQLNGRRWRHLVRKGPHLCALAIRP